MEIISGLVSTPMMASASGKAICRARVEIPTPLQRSQTRAPALPTFLERYLDTEVRISSPS